MRHLSLAFFELACEPSGVFDQKEAVNVLAFYPNPAGDYLHIEGPSPNVDFTFEVFHSVGRSVFSTKNSLNLEAKQLGSGLFNVVVRQEGKVWVGRFLMN